MKTIIHLSDLHFGRENNEVVTALLQEIHHRQPNVVVVSGDLTQRAKSKEFEAAASFLAKLNVPYVVVPGNHDVPLYNLTRRFLSPFSNYTRYINAELFPSYQDDLCMIVGVNTAYAFTWKSGRVTMSQLKSVERQFGQAKHQLKVLVAHHPYHEIFNKSGHTEFLTTASVDLILSGHIHRSRASVLSSHISKLNQRTLLVEAGTSLSTRLRGEGNSFNYIEVFDSTQVAVTIMEYTNTQFIAKLRYHFTKTDGVWCQAAKPL